MRRLGRQSSRLLTVGGSILSAFIVAMLPAHSEPVTDAAIAAAVEREYFRDAAVTRRNTEITVRDGVVMLEGEVSSLAARQQAEDIAGIVRGVRSVINRLRLAPTVRSGAAIERDVEDALGVDPVAELYEIDVEALANNEVLLRGRVESWAEREEIENAVKTVPGVMSIRNELDVAYTTNVPRGQAEIAEEIESRFRWDVRVDDSLINVLVLDGSRVVLSGTVGSLAEKRHAERLAHVAGVADVLSTQLSVEPWARNEALRRDISRPQTTDAAIAAALTTTLRYDPRVAAENVSVSTRDRQVVLSGDVVTILARRAAEEDAWNTYGVNAVRNDLLVVGGVRDDATIERLITNALRAYGLIEGNDIEVTATNGNVRLSGDVRNAYGHWRAEQIASAVQGVRVIDNEVTVNGREPTFLTRIYQFDPQADRFVSVTEEDLKSDREIYDDVASELFWSPFVDSDSIEIDVEGGVVTLTGHVDSAREYVAARENAFEGGALVVHNELTLAN